MSFFFFFNDQYPLDDGQQSEEQVKPMMFIPQEGDTIYEKLSTMFRGERNFEEGFNEAVSIVKTLCATPNYPFNLRLLINNLRYREVALPLIWVLLKLQYEISEMEKYSKEMEVVLSTSVRDEAYLKLCMKSIDEWIDCRLEIMMKRLTNPTAKMLQALPSITNNQKAIMEWTKSVKDAEAKRDGRLRKCQLENEDLKKRVEEAERERDMIKEEMESKEFRDKTGQDYLITVFDEFLAEAENMDQTLRSSWFNVLQGFCTLNAVPQEIKSKIQALKLAKGAQLMNINGDYVAGDKKVEHEVDCVEKGGTGIKIKKNRK